MAQPTTIARQPAPFVRRLQALSRRPALVPCLLATGIFLALGASEAGFYPIGTDDQPGLGWYPAGLLLLALLAATAIAGWPPRRPPRALVLALALLAGYALWSYLSITWADQKAVAWDGANRAAVYLVVLALFSLWPLGARGALAILGLIGLGIAALGLVELLKVNSSATPGGFFTDGRFAEPAGYINANVALWTIGLWPCLYLAAARDVHPLVRGAGLGGAVLLASLALMGQSRGWVFAVPVAIVVFVVLATHRARALAAVGATALGTLLTAGAVLAVHDDIEQRSLDALVADATTTVLVVSALFALLGVAAAVVERRLAWRVAPEPAGNRIAGAGLAGALALGALVFVASGGLGRLSDSWETFKHGGEGAHAGESRFSSVGTNRYDFWTVAVDLFEEHPLRGIGSENFQQPYLARGNSDEQPRYPHSLELGILSQTGLIGAGLLGGALLAAGLAALRGRRRGPPQAAAAAAVAGSVFAYWLLHASIDWFWEFPGLTAPALAALGIAATVAEPREEGAAHRARLLPVGLWDRLARVPGGPRALGTGLAVAAAALLATSLTAPWLAEREIDRATRTWASSPTSAFDKLERAGDLNPLSTKVNLTAATIAVRLEDQPRAFRELREVLRKEPHTPFALAELAALAYERGERARAIRLLERARAASPRDEVIREALSLVLSRKRLDAESLNESYLEFVARFDRDVR